MTSAPTPGKQYTDLLAGIRATVSTAARLTDRAAWIAEGYLRRDYVPQLNECHDRLTVVIKDLARIDRETREDRPFQAHLINRVSQTAQEGLTTWEATESKS